MYGWMKHALFKINWSSTIHIELLDLRADQGLQEFFTRFLFTENKWKLIICLIYQALEFRCSNSIPENSYSIPETSYSIHGNSYSIPENSYSIP